MANHFLDSNNGGATRDGSSTSNAWTTIEYPLANTFAWIGVTQTGTAPVTTPGDIIWIKDNHHEIWTVASLSRVRWNASATLDNPVIYRGDLAGTHFSTTGSRPIIEMKDSGNAWFDNLLTRLFIVFEDIDFYYDGNASTPDTFFDMNNGLTIFRRCNFGGASGSGKEFAGAFNAASEATVVLEDCTIDGADSTRARKELFSLHDAIGVAHRCTLNEYRYVAAHFNGNWYRVEIDELTVTNPVASGAIFDTGNSGSSGSYIEVFGRGLDPGGMTPVIGNPGNPRANSRVYITDYNDVERSFYFENRLGTIESSEAAGDANRSGGADHVFVVTPTDECDPYTLGEDGLTVLDYPISADTSSQDYSVWVKPTAWTTFPTASNLVFEIGWYDTASSASRTWTASTDTMTATNGTWSELTVTGITPAEDGEVVARVRLTTNDGGAGEELTFDYDDLIPAAAPTPTVITPLLYTPHAGI